MHVEKCSRRPRRQKCSMENFSKARIKFIQSLQHKKFRLKYDKFIVEGLKITTELLRDKKQIIEEIYISNPDYQSILENSVNPDLLHIISPQQMNQISQMATPPGVLTVCTLPPVQDLPANLSNKKIFYLDSIRDPGNLGTILRIADWFGLCYVICSPDCVDQFNHKVLPASMGSALRVNVSEMTKEEVLLRSAAELFICDTDGTSIHSMD